MTAVGDMIQYGSHVNPHFGSGNIITALFHVVHNTAKEGSINFYDGLDDKNIGKIYTSLPCEHGRVTIRLFNHIIHGASEWEGMRGSIALNLNKRF